MQHCCMYTICGCACSTGIVDKFIIQAGIYTESVYGGAFKDDPGGLALKHDRKGQLFMANGGPDTNTAHFSILMAPAPHLDGACCLTARMFDMGRQSTTGFAAAAAGQAHNVHGTISGLMFVCRWGPLIAAADFH